RRSARVSIACSADRRRRHSAAGEPMQPILYAHPFSSYCQKVLVALYENGTPFECRHLEENGHMDELARRWPIKRFPLLVDGAHTVIEASTIIEHLQLHHPGPSPMITAEPERRWRCGCWNGSSTTTCPRRSRNACSTCCARKPSAMRAAWPR